MNARRWALGELQRVVRQVASREDGVVKVLRWSGAGPAAVRRWVVLDASFNPPTLAHVAMLKQGMEAVGESVGGVLLVTTKNADKAGVDEVQMAHRLAMLQGVMEEELQGHPIGLAVGNRALFSEKAVLLKQELGEEQGVWLMMGADTLVRLVDPKYYGEDPGARDEALQGLITTLSPGGGGIIVLHRHGTSLDLNSRHFCETHPNHITLLQHTNPTLSTISSTLARTALATSHSSTPLLQLIPASVARYAAQHRLYL